MDCSLAESLYPVRDFNAEATTSTSTESTRLKASSRKAKQIRKQEQKVSASDYESVGSPGFGGGGRFGPDGIFYQNGK